LPSNTKALLSYVLYPTSFLAFRRSALELVLPIPRALVSGMKHWMAERDYDLRRPDRHAYFKQWDLLQAKEEFTVAPPGRVRISRHLLEYARYYGPSSLGGIVPLRI
jgi:hypothetical protein